MNKFVFMNKLNIFMNKFINIPSQNNLDSLKDIWTFIFQYGYRYRTRNT